jgi:hypothetical protein
MSSSPPPGDASASSVASTLTPHLSTLVLPAPLMRGRKSYHGYSTTLLRCPRALRGHRHLRAKERHLLSPVLLRLLPKVMMVAFPAHPSWRWPVGLPLPIMTWKSHRWSLTGRRRSLCRPANPPSPLSHGKVLTNLIGLYFNCFSDRHVAKDCPNLSCCLRCLEPGHQASECRRTRFLLGDHTPRRTRYKRPPSALSRGRNPPRLVRSTTLFPVAGLERDADNVIPLH